MLERFSKSSDRLLALKQSFFDDNDLLLAKALRWAELYVAQPPRTECMACGAPLGAMPSFIKHGVGYSLCDSCGHLNGRHRDTDAYAAAVYTDDGGAQYAEYYSAGGAAQYAERVAAIYAPKAAFLFDALRSDGVDDPAALAFADLGAGSGYFAAALAAAGAADVQAWEPSSAQVELARAMSPLVRIETHELDAITELAAGVEADVVSLIGVLEHLQRPREVLAALASNARVGHVFISVPLFSPTVLIEAALPQVFPRQLSGAHTHLFTDGSLARLERDFGLERTGAWWFGTDMVDLYRSLAVALRDAGLADQVRDQLLPAVDDLQAALDRRRVCSEVHLLWRTP